jgi:hypothetical protein
MYVYASTLFKSILSLLQIMGLWVAALLAGYGTYARLISSGTVVTPSTTWAAIAANETVFSGYAPIAVTSFGSPGVDSNGNCYVDTMLLEWSNNGGGSGDQIGAIVLVQQIAGSTQATGTVTTTGGVVSAPVITLGGAGYTVAPRVVVDGGGTGAVVTATITAGVVTALTLASGGTGYTAATLVIDPPLQIVGANNFDNAVPMVVSTDRLNDVASLVITS